MQPTSPESRASRVLREGSASRLRLGTQDFFHVSVLVDALGEETIGQPEAVKAFARAAVRAVDVLAKGDRPAAVLLVAGPTGSGKGYLARVLARLLLGSERRIIKVHPSFHPDARSFLHWLAWACAQNDLAAGGNPLRMVFVESVEKCPPALIDLFVHIFASGRVSGMPDLQIDFRHTIFVLETALGEREAAQHDGRGVGFTGSESGARELANSRIRTQLDEAIEASFSPRFLSLVDETVLFRRLWPDDLPFLLEKMVARLQARLTERGLFLHVDDVARQFLLGEGRRNLGYGAKGLRHAVDRFLEVPILDVLYAHPPKPGSILFARRSLEGLSLFVPGTEDGVRNIPLTTS